VAPTGLAALSAEAGSLFSRLRIIVVVRGLRLHLGEEDLLVSNSEENMA
jgi:hypothetical protein